MTGVVRRPPSHAPSPGLSADVRCTAGPTYAHPWDVDAMQTCGSGQAPALGSVCWKTRVFGLVCDDDPPL